MPARDSIIHAGTKNITGTVPSEGPNKHVKVGPIVPVLHKTSKHMSTNKDGGLPFDKHNENETPAGGEPLKWEGNTSYHYVTGEAGSVGKVTG